MDVKLIVSVVVSILFVCQGDARCSFPCTRQDFKEFVGVLGPTKGFTATFSCADTSVYTRSDRGVTQCHERDGPFIVVRTEGNTYQCAKLTALDRRGRIYIFYALPKVKKMHNPTLCEVCSGPGKWVANMFVDEPLLRYDLTKDTQTYQSKTKPTKETKPTINLQNLKLPPLGCTVPANCRVKNPFTDKKCTGCEPKEDDGLCCRQCQPKHSYYY